MGMMRSLSAEEHDRVLSVGVNVLIFRVTESPACQRFQPELDQFVAQHPGCPVWVVEAMEQRDLAERHELRKLPTIVIYRDGLPARRFFCGMSAKDLRSAVNEVTHADMHLEYSNWMFHMLDTGEAGSPFVKARPTLLDPTNHDSPAAKPVGGFSGVVAATRRWRQRWTARRGGHHWRRARLGTIPSGAVAHGHEANGTPLWVCRARLVGGLHPGKVRPGFGGALVAWNGGEIRVDEYEVLMEAGEWQQARFGAIPADSRPCGYEATGEELFVARATIGDGDMQLGKVRSAFGAANIGYGNQELKVRSYEVLVRS
jgi:Protein of unknown function (DUF3421)/Thioredoxin